MPGRTKPLNVKDPEAYRLARALADQTGETLTETVIKALRERLRRVNTSPPGRDLVAEMKAISERVSRLPILDRRSDDEILDYNKDGIFD